VTFTLLGRGFELLRPWALWLLLLLPLVWVGLRLSLVDLGRGQQRLSAALRTLLLLLGVLALSRPSTIGERRTVATVILVDVSDSISDKQLEAARQLVDEARHARTGDDVLRVATFARHPKAVELPPDGQPLPPVSALRHTGEGDGSDLESALQLAYGLFPPGTIRRALVVSDGNQTSGNLAAEAVRARDRGVRVDVATFPAAQDDEVLVRALQLPPDVKIGAPFEVSAEIYSSRPQRATVTLYRDEFINPGDGRREVALAAGANLVKFRAEVAQPGFTVFKAVLSGAGGKLADHFPANNQAAAAVAVRGKPRVLYVEGVPQASSYLANALRHENIDVEVRSAYGLPSSPRELQRYDLVLVSDVPAMFAGPAQLAAIESYVRDLGGTFLMAGGENSFGSGGYTGSKMESLLPVRFDVEKKRDQPHLALVLAIDRSGSMTGEKIDLAKEAARATAELLGADDQIGVVAFDSQAFSLVRLQRAANRVRIANEISSLQAGGGTNILPALKMAYDALDPAPAKIKHVILLTDGQATYDGIQSLVDEMVEHRITLSAVGVGAEADKTLLTMIAERGGGRFYHTNDAQSVPRIFTKEAAQVARSALVEEAVRVQVSKHAELLAGLPMAEAPPLRGYVVTKPKPRSEVILESGLGEPILARWRVGLGQAVAFTSDVKNRWAADWVRWPGYAKFWAQVVRGTMRHSPGQGGSTGAGASFDLTTELDPPYAHVAVDAISGEDRFISGLTSTLQVIDPDKPGKPLELPLTQTASGRYQATFTLDRHGAYLLRAVHKLGGTEVAESTGTLSLPYAREYLALPADEALLERVARTTAGRVRPSAAQLFDPGSQKVTFNRELWPGLLWVMLALLLLDVASRRVRLFGR